MQGVLKKLALLLAAAVLVPVANLGPARAGRSNCFEGDSSKRGLMRGDINGDGNRDEVWIAARRVNGRCRYFVKADMGAARDRKILRGEGADRFALRHFSRVAAMVELDLVGGKEFPVVLNQGASTVFVGVYTIRANEIRRGRFDGPGAPDDDLLGYGGSVGGQIASDCARHRPPGQIINSTALYKSDINRYRVKRRWFATEGVSTHFERTPQPTDKRTVRPSHLSDFYEFRNNPFGSCTGRVRG